MPETIRPTYEESCPNCKFIGDSEAEMCDKHWDKLQHDIAAIHADGNEEWEEIIYRLMVEGDNG